MKAHKVSTLIGPFTKLSNSDVRDPPNLEVECSGYHLNETVPNFGTFEVGFISITQSTGEFSIGGIIMNPQKPFRNDI